jgi:hypothetical protein
VWFNYPGFPPSNPLNPFDVSADGLITPLDAIMVINLLNSSGPIKDPLAPSSLGYVDVDADGTVTPTDAILVINQLNSPVRIPPKPRVAAFAGAASTSPASSGLTAPSQSLSAAAVDLLLLESLAPAQRKNLQPLPPTS